MEEDSSELEGKNEVVEDEEDVRVRLDQVHITSPEDNSSTTTMPVPNKETTQSKDKLDEEGIKIDL